MQFSDLHATIIGQSRLILKSDTASADSFERDFANPKSHKIIGRASASIFYTKGLAMPAKRVFKCFLLILLVLVCISASVPSVLISEISQAMDTAAEMTAVTGDSILSESTPGNPAGSSAGSMTVRQPQSDSRADVWAEHYRLFPKHLFTQHLPLAQRSFGPLPAHVISSQEEAQQELAHANKQRQPLLADSQIFAFYGKPGARSMGILGEYSKEQLAPLLEAYAKLYDDLNGSRSVIPAFYIIYGTCWPEGEIGITSKSVIEDYIRFALERNWLVFLDHQIGRYTVEQALGSMLPFLHYPNVHLALDPEWRTLKPMKEIGTISAAEFNNAQKIMNDYLVANQLPGVRMLIVHQFHPRMLTNPEQVVANQDRVIPVHVADGIGSPALKRHSYLKNAEYTNMPMKGFKLFFESKVVGATWDTPLMTPEEVLALDPQPVLIMYQ